MVTVDYSIRNNKTIYNDKSTYANIGFLKIPLNRNTETIIDNSVIERKETVNCKRDSNNKCINNVKESTLDQEIDDSSFFSRTNIFINASLNIDLRKQSEIQDGQYNITCQSRNPGDCKIIDIKPEKIYKNTMFLLNDKSRQVRRLKQNKVIDYTKTYRVTGTIIGILFLFIVAFFLTKKPKIKYVD